MTGESMELEELRRAAAALGDRTRFAMLLRLQTRPHRVGELVDELQLSQPLVSHHLAVLVSTGWARKDGAGKRSAYSMPPASREPMATLQRLLRAVATQCQGPFEAPEVAPADPSPGAPVAIVEPVGRSSVPLEDYLL